MSCIFVFAGYMLDSDGMSCVDINECEVQDGGCDHYCVNTPGSRVCACRSGYSLSANGVTCQSKGHHISISMTSLS